MRGKTFAVQNAKQKAKTTKPRRKEELIHMKFTVEKRLLNEAVTNLQRAVSSKTSIPALEGILIRSEEKSARDPVTKATVSDIIKNIRDR